MNKQEIDALEAKWKEVVEDTAREESGMSYCYEEWMEAPNDIAALIAEVRTLQAKLDAVPVASIRIAFFNDNGKMEPWDIVRDWLVSLEG